MAFIRKEEPKPQGFVDPSTRYTPTQLESFYQRVLEGDDNLDETIDLWLHNKSPISFSEILQSDAYKDKWWKMHQPVVPCCITTIKGYLNNFDNWFNPGRTAFMALVVLADLDRKFWREQQVAGVANEINRVCQLLKKYNTKDEDADIFNACTTGEKYANFINDVFAGKIIDKEYLGSVAKTEEKLRAKLTRALARVVVMHKYSLENDLGSELYEKFKEDAEGLFYEIFSEDFRTIVPFTSVIKES